MADAARWAAGDERLAPSADRVLARRAIEAVPAGGDEVEAARRALLDAIGWRDDPADRRTRPGHLTGSAFVVRPDGSAAVLLFHRKLQRWLQPGGHADGDMNLAGVALREAMEETGLPGLEVDPLPLDLDVHEVRPPGEDPHLHLDVRYLVVAPADARLAGNEESTAIRWVPRGDLEEYDLDPGLRRLAAAAWARLDG